MGGMKLFDDDDATADDFSKIEVNEEFARRYEHNKKREDLQRYEELKKSGQIDDDDSESDSESSDDEDDIAGANKKKDIKFFENLLKVRKQDPSLYENVPIFSDSEEEEEGNDGEKGEEDDDGNVDEKQEESSKKKRKSMYLKDVVAKNLIEDGPEYDDMESSRQGKRGKTYNEEQEELRQQFLDAVKDDEGNKGEGEFLKVKDKGGDEGNGEDDEVFEAKLGEYFGPQEELDENKMFLMEFFKNKMWADKNERENGFGFDDIDELDEEEVEKQEAFEERYNFRHEEDRGDRVMGHSRFVEGAIRKEENPRKEQRKRKQERMKEAEMRRKEELKHLKNLKKKEMEEKLQKVMEVAGIKSDNGALNLDELEDDFDPQQYDNMMKKAFDDGYYEAEDADPGFCSGSDDDSDIKKPDFDKEDELLGLPKGWDTADNEGDFASVREKILKEKGMSVDDGEDEQAEGEEEGGKDGREDEGKRKKQKRKLTLLQKTKQELLDEYYKLDYEGTIGDLKTRFKYAKVNPNKYGLKTEDILLLEDQDLNQYVSVKKLAPYRESEWKVPANQKNQYKMKVKELKNNLDIRRSSKKDKNTKVNSNNNIEESTSAGLSRKARRKQHQAHLKLSHGRLLAYGKVQPSAKSKKKV